MKITVIVLTYNEATNIAGCLDSLSDLDCSVFVVDSYSTDATLDILNTRGIAYAQHPFENYARQRNWAQAHCPFETEWVLHLDAGERLTPELSDWLGRHFDASGPNNGYLFSRRTMFMDRWIRHGGHYPNYHLRLFRRTLGSCEAKSYDQHFVCQGPLVRVPAGADLIDHVAGNLAGFTTAHSRWALLEAIEQVQSGAAAGEVHPRFWGTPIERRRWLKTRLFNRSPLFLRAFLYFFYRYILRFGFLDGAPGLVFHFLQGCWFRFLIDATVLEIRLHQRRTGQPVEQIIQELYSIPERAPVVGDA